MEKGSGHASLVVSTLTAQQSSLGDIQSTFLHSHFKCIHVVLMHLT